MSVILIGMPASGKSTAGVILAKVLGLDYMDTDLLIQRMAGQRLHAIIEERGVDGFLELEEEACLRIGQDPAAGGSGAVIATGGSAVYSEAAVRHLRSLGTVIYLQVPYPVLQRRLRNIRQRGVVLREGQSLRDLYEERVPLYERYADITIPEEADGTAEDTVDRICAALEGASGGPSEEASEGSSEGRV